MYTLRYDKENGDVFHFDFEHGIIVDLDPLSEMDVEISTSQGVSQIGSTVENRTVAGLTRVLTGKIVGDANETKEHMLTCFSTFSSGKLYFNDKFYCDCVVDKTPAIGVLKKDVVFTISLYCSYPFWLSDQSTMIDMNVYTACFKFPGPTSGLNGEYPNYDTHIYAIRNSASFFNIYNESEVDTRFSCTFYVTDSIVTNYGIINARTLEKIQIDDTLSLGEKVKVYWEDDILKVEKTMNGVTTNIFSLLNEDSDLFWLYQGDNIIQAFAEEGGFPNVAIEYNNTYVGVYDGK